MGACSARPCSKGVHADAKLNASRRDTAHLHEVQAAAVSPEIQNRHCTTQEPSTRQPKVVEQGKASTAVCTDIAILETDLGAAHLTQLDLTPSRPIPDPDVQKCSDDVCEVSLSEASTTAASKEPTLPLTISDTGMSPGASFSPCQKDDLEKPMVRPNLSSAQCEVIAMAEQLLPEGRMSTWQRSWCTPDTVDIYLNGRKGDINKAAEILAKALAWRQEHECILSGKRVPKWAGDMRVAARASTGQPICYMCTKNQPSGPKTADVVEHFAVVLETAVQSMQGDATGIIVVSDLHGFSLRQHLSPRPAMALAQMLQQPYRDRLHMGILVDAPGSFHSLWKLFSAAVSETTRNKIQFMSRAEAAERFPQLLGPSASEKIMSIMDANRMNGPAPEMQIPSEVLESAPNEASQSSPLAISNVSGKENYGFIQEPCSAESQSRPGHCSKVIVSI